MPRLAPVMSITSRTFGSISFGPGRVAAGDYPCSPGRCPVPRVEQRRDMVPPERAEVMADAAREPAGHPVHKPVHSTVLPPPRGVPAMLRCLVLSLSLALPISVVARSADIRGPGLAGHPRRAVHLRGMQ